MRILKYIFLLLLLSVVALSIFIATQKGDFKVERSKVINSPKEVVFNYVNDLKNWSDFGSWTLSDPETSYTYPANTVGRGGSYSWESKDGDGKIATLYVKANDSIAQKMNFNGSDSKVAWKFKDTIGGTKVTWSTEGKMSFTMKIYAALNGGVNRVIGSLYEKSLSNLDKALDYEVNTFKVKVDGVVQKPMMYYLSQTFTSELSKINKNFNIVIPKIKTFCEQNGVNTVGKPFIIYHTYDLQTQLAKISICMPIDHEIFLSAGSDILSSKIEAYGAVKATLTGDNSHNKKAYDQALALFTKSNFVHNPTISHIEVYAKNKNEVKNASQWVTEVYIPMPAAIVPATVKSINSPAAGGLYQEPATTTTAPTSANTNQAVGTATNPNTVTPKKVVPKKPKKVIDKEVAPATPKKEVAPKAVTEDDEFEF
ncbi:SRPBCC family protein [Flavobacterium frigidarium]|uniref:SRPBCC family protein n=1 Tax=Flavobacterium frigidarium TaxID=99286 RepID=UPI0004122781|nr:SRPBCC family protein [Flavobacterium frigidarium]